MKFSLYNQLTTDFCRYLNSFTSQDIKQCVKFQFRHDDTINFRIYFESGSPINSEMANKVKKTGREKYTFLNISRTKGAFLAKE